MNGDLRPTSPMRVNPAEGPGKRSPLMADVQGHRRSLYWQEKTSKSFPESARLPADRPGYTGYTVLETCTGVAECGMLADYAGDRLPASRVTSVLRAAIGAVLVPDGSRPARPCPT